MLNKVCDKLLIIFIFYYKKYLILLFFLQIFKINILFIYYLFYLS